MYCPQCSQQQISDEMRFCSRCGFPLTTVRELIAGGGAPLAREDQELESRRIAALRVARQGALIMLASFPMALFVGLLTAIEDGFAVLGLIPFLTLVVGFFRLLYGVFCKSRAPRRKASADEPRVLSTTTFSAGEQLNAPPSIQFLQNKKTAEVVQPPSVTENTTRLLDEDANASNQS
jgi:hypothetical protein